MVIYLLNPLKTINPTLQISYPVEYLVNKPLPADGNNNMDNAQGWKIIQ